MLYALFAVVWHMDVPMFGTLVLAGLAGYCAQHAVWLSATVRRALTLPFLCVLSLLGVQLLFHGEPVRGDFVQTFVTWMLSLVVVQSLALRQGFVHRFGLMCFFIGLMTLPYMQFDTDAGGSRRLGLDRRVSFANPNDFGAWFGFCTVYFVALAVESKRQSIRIMATICAVAAAVVLGATVSRGPLLSAATAIIIVFRRSLKRGFLPLIILFAVFNLAFALGVFDQIVEYYFARGDVDSGRLSAWPLVLGRIWQAPLIGVGISDMETWVPKMGTGVTPHNAFLFMALSSGVLPFLFFATYMARAARNTLAGFVHRAIAPEQAFRLPLLCYALLSCLTLDLPFMAPWALTALSLASLDSPRRLFLGRYGSVAASPEARPRYA
jgi:hypothetical protein